MDTLLLRALLVGKGRAKEIECERLSGRRWVPTAEWQRLRRHEQQWLRCYAVGASTNKAVLVLRAAARMNGMWVLPLSDDPVELILPSSHPPPRRQWPDNVMYKHMDVPEIDIHVAECGVRCTRPIRTAIDIARYKGFREGVIAFDSLFRGLDGRQRRQLHADVGAAVERLAGVRGIETARRAFAACSSLSESPFETLLRLILADAGIIVAVQMWVGPYRVDLLWGQLIIEVDGRAKYSDAAQATVMAQLERENWLKEIGYEVIRIFSDEILKDEAGCVARILRAKERADQRGAPRFEPTEKQKYHFGPA